ncbi:MAG TPA: PIN domain-containing protein [Terriglobia bacterium]|nr:PIN domain-containing protein [Terriglobia bacterium]
MAGELLLDTGALVALLDRSQSVHHACVDFYAMWRGAVVTTEAVLTESIYLLSDIPRGASSCIDFILQGGIFLVPSTEVTLQRCRTLMEKYHDLPMDFADATLVALAEELNTNLVFTVDRDFRVYRIRGRKAFEILPTA